MSPRVRVKICGVTNRADAEMAIAHGADALGFNLFAGSKRCIDLAAEADWIRELAPFVTRVAVMVNPTRSEAEKILANPLIDVVQFHGQEDESFCSHFAKHGRPFIKAISLTGITEFRDVTRFHTRNILLDAYVPGQFGGTGKLIDLALAEQFSREHPENQIVLSGGLTPDNVGEAIRRVRPYAVDVASGVESAPRKKDSTLVEAFIAAVRDAEIKL